MKNWCRYWVLCLFTMSSWVFPLGCSNAQSPICGFDQQWQRALSEKEAWEEQVEMMDQQLKRAQVLEGANSEGRGELLIPVVFHILWHQANENISDQKILEQIDILNRDFNAENEDLYKVPAIFQPHIAKDGIQFCLANTDPWGRVTTGIIRRKTEHPYLGTQNQLFYSEQGGSSAWDTDRYLNIWIANTGDFITGYGTFPNQGTTAEQGIVVHPQYIGLNDSNNHPLGRVLVHEMGHFLGLYHTWNNDIECHIDDEVADTPFQEKAYFACPDFPQKSCGSSDMFMNFMDYVDDECMQLFTQGQMDRMKNTIRYFRPGLLHQQSNCFIEEQITEPSPFSIYPNPSRGSIYIRFEKNPPSILQLALYDLTGRLIVQREGLYQESIPIHLPPLSAGIYWLRINDKSQKLFIN